MAKTTENKADEVIVGIDAQPVSTAGAVIEDAVLTPDVPGEVVTVEDVESSKHSAKDYVLRGVGGVPDGNWHDLTPEQQQYVQVQYPDVYAAILRDLDSASKADNSAMEEQKKKVLRLEEEARKKNEQAALLVAENQASANKATLDEALALAQARVKAADDHLELVKAANKRNQPL